MVSAVFDTSVLVSAFLTRHQPGGVTNELLRLAADGGIELRLSADIIAETVTTLVRNRRAQANYRYTPEMAEAYCAALFDLAAIIENPPSTPGAVPRDPDDDKIIACAVAAGVEYLVSRDRDLLSLGAYDGIMIIAPEPFLDIARGQ
jgi:putative PIN family toxin of toxin-antitoxin system